MEKMKLGRAGLYASRSGFGALPIQRVGLDEAGLILKKAYDNGINFFDTARAYTDSEEKIGRSLADVRKNIIIASKSGATGRAVLTEHLQKSLKELKTDYIDIYQLHNPGTLPDPEDPEGSYQALLDARRKGLVRFIGITSHRTDVAMEAVESGLYDTVQFPLSSLSSKEDLKIVKACREKDIGLIAMKALSGGLITNASSAFAFLRQFDNVLPIWGIQRESELDQFIAMENDPPVMDEEMHRVIEKDRAELSGAFCRGCGYCMPCPTGIPINMAARISLLLRRAPYQKFLTDEWKNQMELIEKCTECGQCRKKCPYGLDTPELLKDMLRDYREFYSRHV